MLDENDTENAFDTRGNLHDYLNRRPVKSIKFILFFNRKVLMMTLRWMRSL
jgi:hypothetical protein